MKTILIRLVTVLAGAGIVVFISRILLVPEIQLGLLSGWGLFCMLFSYEMAGSRRIYRQGFQERSWLERAWLVAGAGCLVSTGILMLLHF